MYSVRGYKPWSERHKLHRESISAAKTGLKLMFDVAFCLE